jgi:ankyrin repeat protein
MVDFQFSGLMKDLITRLLEPDYKKRPAMSEIALYTPNHRQLFLQNQLVSAAKNGELTLIEASLSQGIPIDHKDVNGKTPLFHAATEGHNNIVIHLLKSGADLTIKSKLGISPLVSSIRNGHNSVVETLLSAGADVNEIMNNGMTPVLFAAANGSVKALELLLKNGAEVNQEESHGWTPLILAVRNGHKEIANYLKKLPEVKVSHTDFRGRTIEWHEMKFDSLRILTAPLKSGEQRYNPSTLAQKIDVLLQLLVQATKRQ